MQKFKTIKMCEQICSTVLFKNLPDIFCIENRLKKKCLIATAFQLCFRICH
jgi:hypothetical protein